MAIVALMKHVPFFGFTNDAGQLAVSGCEAIAESDNTDLRNFLGLTVEVAGATEDQHAAGWWIEKKKC